MNDTLKGWLMMLPAILILIFLFLVFLLETVDDKGWLACIIFIGLFLIMVLAAEGIHKIIHERNRKLRE